MKNLQSNFKATTLFIAVGLLLVDKQMYVVVGQLWIHVRPMSVECCLQWVRIDFARSRDQYHRFHALLIDWSLEKIPGIWTKEGLLMNQPPRFLNNSDYSLVKEFRKYIQSPTASKDGSFYNMFLDSTK